MRTTKEIEDVIEQIVLKILFKYVITPHIEYYAQIKDQKEGQPPGIKHVNH